MINSIGNSAEHYIAGAYGLKEASAKTALERQPGGFPAAELNESKVKGNSINKKALEDSKCET